MKRSVKAAAVAALLFATSLAGGCGQVKLGYIDGSRVVEEAPQLKAVVEESNQKMEEIQKEAEDAFAKKENPTAEDFQQAQMEMQQKFQSISSAYAVQLRQKLDVAVGEVVKAKGLDAVVESEKLQPSVLVGGTDITDEVIQKLQ